MAESLNEKLERIERKLDLLLERSNASLLEPSPRARAKRPEPPPHPSDSWMMQLSRILKGSFPGHDFGGCWQRGLTPEQAYQEWRDSVSAQELAEWDEHYRGK